MIFSKFTDLKWYFDKVRRLKKIFPLNIFTAIWKKRVDFLFWKYAHTRFCELVFIGKVLVILPPFWMDFNFNKFISALSKFLIGLFHKQAPKVKLFRLIDIILIQSTWLKIETKCFYNTTIISITQYVKLAAL